MISFSRRWRQGKCRRSPRLFIPTIESFSLLQRAALTIKCRFELRWQTAKPPWPAPYRYRCIRDKGLSTSKVHCRLNGSKWLQLCHISDLKAWSKVSQALLHIDTIGLLLYELPSLIYVFSDAKIPTCWNVLNRQGKCSSCPWLARNLSNPAAPYLLPRTKGDPRLEFRYYKARPSAICDDATSIVLQQQLFDFENLHIINNTVIIAWTE